MAIQPSVTASPESRDIAERFDDGVHESQDATRYRWLRDHCTKPALDQLIELSRQHAGHPSRREFIDRAIDEHIARDLLARDRRLRPVV